MEKQTAIAALVISILALIVSISLSFFQPEIIEDCAPSTYFNDDEALVENHVIEPIQE